ncbi:hypothetical protein [Providencia hangzhouensis]
MSEKVNLQKSMLLVVADALGEELLAQVVFVGGCTTGLLVTDEYTKEQIRYTDDVDFMPVDQNALGFSNRWYKDAVEMACQYQLTQNVTINLIRPEYFIATKLEAYLGRVNGDLLSSRDIEDILNIFDGRESIVEEISQSSTALKEYISNNLALLINEYDFEMAVQSTSQGIRSREDIIFERLTQCIKH